MEEVMSEVRVTPCTCPCHTPTQGSVMMHFTACCEGMCPHCGRWFKKGRDTHRKQCLEEKIQLALALYQREVSLRYNPNTSHKDREAAWEEYSRARWSLRDVTHLEDLDNRQHEWLVQFFESREA